MGGSPDDPRVKIKEGERELRNTGVAQAAQNLGDFENYMSDSGIEEQTGEDYWAPLVTEMFQPGARSAAMQSKQTMEAVRSASHSTGMGYSGSTQKRLAGIAAQGTAAVGAERIKAEMFGEQGMQSARNQWLGMEQTQAGMEGDFLQQQQEYALRLAEWNESYDPTNTKIIAANKKLGVNL
jgi:hypothetical protein